MKKKIMVLARRSAIRMWVTLGSWDSMHRWCAWIASTTPRDMPVVMMDSRDSARSFLPLYLNQSLQSKGVGGFEVFVLVADALDKRSLQGRALSLTVIPPPTNDNANKKAPLYIMGNVHVLSTSGRCRSQPWHGAHVSPYVRPHGASQNHRFQIVPVVF